MKSLIKGKFLKPLIFCLAVFLLFTSCSFMDNLKKGSLHFRLGTETVNRLKAYRNEIAGSDKDDNLYIMIYINGDYETQLEEPEVITGKEFNFTFEGIPIEAGVYAQAEVYCYKKVSETVEKQILYEGKSDYITVKSGKNEINLSLARVAPYEDPRVEYTVRHLLQPLEGDVYEEVEADRETLLGLPGETSAASAKEYEGFTAKSFDQLVIEENGSTVISIYYMRNVITLTFDLDGGETETELTEGTLTGLYGAALSVAEPEKENFEFEGWSPELPETFPATAPETPYKALWSKIPEPVIPGDVVITVTVEDIPENTITVNVTDDDADPYVKVFTAEEGYDSYTWMVDGIAQTEKSNAFSFDMTELPCGRYDITMLAEKDGMYYSCSLKAVKE